MLSSLILDLKEDDESARRSAAEPDPPSLPGALVHGWFLTDMVRRLSPAQVAVLHDDRTAENLKPFTASPAWRADERHGENDGAPHRWVRLTALSADMSDLFEAIRVQTIGGVRLDQRRFTATAVHRTGETHGWAASSSFAQLVALGREAARDGVAKVDLSFHSPTAFRRGDDCVSLFPEPERVFRGLLWRWQSLSGLPPLDEYDAGQFLGALLVERHRLKTTVERVVQNDRRVQFEKGFLGRCEYSLGPRPRVEALEILHTLAAFASYAGVGAATARGWGQTSVSWPGWKPAHSLPGPRVPVRRAGPSSPATGQEACRRGSR